jgi:spermidine synthase
MGFSGLIAEILLLREFLIVFSGNELSIGIVLANWLILEALGCFFPGRMAEKSKNRIEAFAVITVLFSLSLILAAFLIRSLKGVLGVSVGESIGLLPILYSSFLILLPVSVLHGALFTFSCRIYSMYSAQDASSAGRVYVYETVGTIIGGIVCTYLIIPYLNAFQAAIGLAILNFVVCLVVLAPYWKTGLFQKATLVILSMLVLFSGYLVLGGQVDKLHHYSIQAQWRNQNVVHYQNSQYGNICVVENRGQYIYFLDGVPAILTPLPDIHFIEEYVHLPLLAHPQPESILIVSGGAGGTINEVLRHPSVATVEYAELDPLILSLLRRFPTPLTESELNDERVKIKQVDGRLLLGTTPNQYDVIFIGIMEPSSLQANRFFTREFFSLAQQRLNEGGILVLGAPGSLTLLNQELKDLNSSIFHTLNSVFSHIRVIPGDGRNIFLSSDSQEISTIDKAQIVERLSERNISASAMVPWHIEKRLHPGWQDWLTHFLEGSSQRINYDFQPVGLFYSISHWNALFAPSFGWLFRQFERINLRVIFLLFVLFLLLYFVLRSRNTRFLPAGIPLSIVTTGFAGMIFSLVVIFTFQSMYGYVFSWIGLLVASFMAGAACGAMLMIMVLARIQKGLRLFIGNELAIICFSIGLPFVFLAVNAYGGGQIAFVLFGMLFLIISFVCGLITGSQFPLANKLYLKNGESSSRTAGLLYASDLLGGWLGGIVGAVVLLPVLGLGGTCVTVGLLKLASLIVIGTQPQSVAERR